MKLTNLIKFVFWPPVVFTVLLCVIGFMLAGVPGQLLLGFVAVTLVGTENPVSRALVKVAEVTHS